MMLSRKVLPSSVIARAMLFRALGEVAFEVSVKNVVPLPCAGEVNGRMDASDTIDWDSDPELKGLLDHFIGTFEERRVRLATWIEVFESGQAGVEALKGLQFEAHKVAGAAATFGFPSLSELGLELDEFLKSDLVAQKGMTPREWAQMARFLDDLLAKVQLKRRDPSEFVGDPRRKIWSIVGECEADSNGGCEE